MHVHPVSSRLLGPKRTEGSRALFVRHCIDVSVDVKHSSAEKEYNLFVLNTRCVSVEASPVVFALLRLEAMCAVDVMQLGSGAITGFPASTGTPWTKKWFCTLLGQSDDTASISARYPFAGSSQNTISYRPSGRQPAGRVSCCEESPVHED